MVLSHTGLNIRAVWTCVMHAGYFLLCAVLLSFLQCPTFSRLSLLVTVPLNAVAEVNQQSAFDLCTLSLLLVILSLGWFIACVRVCVCLSSNLMKSVCLLWLLFLKDCFR